MPQKEPKESKFWEVGQNYLVRLVTHYWVGKLLEISEKEIHLDGASWVADTGRYSTACAEGEGAFEEVEYVGREVMLNREAMIDCVRWTGELPSKTK